MPTINQYTKQNLLRLLLRGPSGVGKTTLAGQLPGVWVIDCDVNLGGPLRYYSREKISHNILGYDTIDLDDEGKEIPKGMRYERLATCLYKASLNPDVQTLVVDSATKVCDYIIDHVLRKHPTKTTLMEMTSWGFFKAYWVDLVAKVTALRKHFVLIAHEKFDKDEADGTNKYLLNIPGQFQTIAPTMFTDVWRCEALDDGLKGSKYQIRTNPSNRFELKNSLGLPPTLPFNWKTIEDALNATL